MTVSREQLFELFKNQIIPELSDLMDCGQKEYSHNSENALANFERVASQLGTSREQVLLVYFLKHVDGIVSWTKGHKSQRENIRGRISDCQVYLSILRAMVEDDQSIEDARRQSQELANGIKQKEIMAKIDAEINSSNEEVTPVSVEEAALRWNAKTKTNLDESI